MPQRGQRGTGMTEVPGAEMEALKTDAEEEALVKAKPKVTGCMAPMVIFNMRVQMKLSAVFLALAQAVVKHPMKSILGAL